MRQFLVERVKDGFSFPINPCWPVRDPAWYEVYTSLKANRESVDNMNSWFPSDSGIMEKIDKLHSMFPGGFKPATEAPKSSGGGEKKPAAAPATPAADGKDDKGKGGGFLQSFV